MKLRLNYKNLLIVFGASIVLSSSIVALCTLGNYSNEKDLLVNKKIINLKTTSTPIISKNIGSQIGAIRHYQNNSFSGTKITGTSTNGFVALTSDNSATRTDMFGNIIWEFDPKTISSNYSKSGDFQNKKVIEITQDQSNNDIFYLLLVPMTAPNQLFDVDPKDPTYYDQMIQETEGIQHQATVVQIQENIHNYANGSWTPSFTIIDHVNINPQKMVENYPKTWTQTISVENSNFASKETSVATSSPSFFSKIDHPSWYINGQEEKVGDAITAETETSPSAFEIKQGKTTTNGLESQSSGIVGTKGMVLPWKQYITNLGNMYARDGKVFIFGGNGSMYNDPEALSIGMFRVDFATFSNSGSISSVTGIPYAYLLSNLKYDPIDESGDKTPSAYWNKCFAPIRQDPNFNYVPRLAVGGIQTNITKNADSVPFLYLGGAITVGQVTNSQNRAWKPNQTQNNDANAKPGSNNVYTPALAVAKSLQQQRSLQLSGQNILSGPTSVTLASGRATIIPPDRNSIDPCLLFGTAFNIDTLTTITVPQDSTSNDQQRVGAIAQETITSFSNVLMDNQYFDIGSTVGNSSTAGTYYFFDDQRANFTSASAINSGVKVESTNANRLAFNLHPGNGQSYFQPYLGVVSNNPSQSDQNYSYSFGSSEHIFNFFGEWDTAAGNIKSGRTKPGKPLAVYETTSPRVTNATNTNDIGSGRKYKVEGTSMASYSWNLPMLTDNAKNYYYPTLCYGYSLKSLGSLTKVKTTTKTGYAMQVGKSILFINEPKFVKVSNQSGFFKSEKTSTLTKIDSYTNLVYHGPSSVSIGDQNTFGVAKFGNETINNSNQNNNYVYKYDQWTKNTSISISNSSVNVQELTNRPFSSSGNFALDSAIVSSGMTQLIAGIKDFNYTISQIAGSFKVSADPYQTLTSHNTKTSKTLSNSFLPWNQFMGLATTNNGNSIASSWAITTTNSNSKATNDANPSIIPSESKVFSLTNHPVFSDYSNVAWTGNTDGSIMTNCVFNDSEFKLESGINRAWFEECATGTGVDIETLIGVFKESTITPNTSRQFTYPPSTRITKDQYFISSPNNSSASNPTLVFNSINQLDEKPLLYGQSPTLAKSVSGIAYLQPETTTYKVYNKPDASKVLGSVTFKTLSVGTSETPGILSKKLSEILEIIPDAKSTYLVKKEFVNELVDIVLPSFSINGQLPTLQNGSKVIIVVTDVNNNNQTATFSVYFWNPITNTYDISVNQQQSNGMIKELTFGQTPIQVVPPTISPENPNVPGNGETNNNQQLNSILSEPWFIPAFSSAAIIFLIIIIGTIAGVIVSKKKARKVNNLRKKSN